MKIVGIVCEYNPFHLGHEWMIRTLREQGADAIVCAMSGNFVQRGDVAIMEKHLRAADAVRGGAEIWPVVLIREGNDYVFTLGDTLDTAALEGTRDEKIEQAARFYTAEIEKFIRRRPEQWFWMHNRWKTKKSED